MRLSYLYFQLLWGTNTKISTVKIESWRNRTGEGKGFLEWANPHILSRAKLISNSQLCCISFIFKLRKIQDPYRWLGRCLDALCSISVFRGQEKIWVWEVLGIWNKVLCRLDIISFAYVCTAASCQNFSIRINI